MKDRWQNLDISAHFASFLDPRFKDLNFLKLSQKREIHNKILELIQEEVCEEQNVRFNNSSKHDSTFFFFFNDQELSKP